MNKNLLKTGVQNFIEKKWNTDIVSVSLKKPFFDDVSQAELAQQLEGKKKSKMKLPTWFKKSGIYYPKKLNLEQTSSETTAAYKAQLVSGKSLVDLTGGFGVDSYFFSKKLAEIFHCEIDAELSKIAAHNFEMLGATNVKIVNQDGITFLNNYKEKLDWVYADPSRRDDKGRVFRLRDCAPNIPEHFNLIFEKTDNILLKTAPLLDIHQGISELNWVKKIHVVAVKNEVKELLWVLEKGYKEAVEITAVNLETQQHIFSFLLEDEKTARPKLSEPRNYLYEPNAAILKAGAFKLVGNRYRLDKLHEHSHLYTSDDLVDFPGRVFKIEKVGSYSKKSMKTLPIKKANVAIRNFPEAVTTIKKKHKIVDGGNHYLFFTTDYTNNLIVVVCGKATHNPI
ncbi:class I SAM-dependent methyltransferase [Allomuricauda sp. d1]|uniref:THUMP-like domain-containing protein n=1 Tax=Allomuricauda sp. d1 TaxID=3136725 RepID=UPI0031CDE529